MPAPGQSPLKTFYRELRRRKVFQTCFYYLLLCWGGLQVVDILFPLLFDLDTDLVSRYLFALAVLGFPVTFTLAWFFQITREGVSRSTPFSERRVLENIPPINDRRGDGARRYFRKSGSRAPVHNWTLSAETGPLAGLSFSITRSLVMGRSLDSDIAVVSPHVSRQHARLELEGDMLTLEDLGSANGTKINGRPVTGRCTLYNDDEIRFHDIVFRVTRSYADASRGKEVLDQTTYIEPVHSNSNKPTKTTDQQ